MFINVYKFLYVAIFCKILVQCLGVCICIDSCCRPMRLGRCMCVVELAIFLKMENGVVIFAWLAPCSMFLLLSVRRNHSMITFCVDNFFKNPLNLKWIPQRMPQISSSHEKFDCLSVFDLPSKFGLCNRVSLYKEYPRRLFPQCFCLFLPPRRFFLHYSCSFSRSRRLRNR